MNQQSFQSEQPAKYKVVMPSEDMHPKVFEGDDLILDMKAAPRDGDLVAAQVEGQTVVGNYTKQGEAIAFTFVNREPLVTRAAAMKWCYPVEGLHRTIREEGGAK